MALQGGALDQPRTTDVGNYPLNYPPEVVVRMRQMGIWHPGINYPLNTKRGQEEADILNSILSQYQRSQELGETRAYREQAHEENLGQRQLAQQQLDEYRTGRLSEQSEAGKARIAQTLQYILNDPTLKEIYAKNPEVRRQVSDAMLRNAGVEPPAAPAPGVATKGEYGPGGAAAAPPAAAPPPGTAADITTNTPASTAQGGGGTPEAPRPTGRYFNPARYAGSGLNPSQMARAASNLDTAQAQDDYFNMLLYKRGIGGPAFEKIYGTSDPALIRAGMPPAADIPDIYRGKSTIPETGQVGYYDSGGKFLGPLYTETGERLPMPKGATGIRGTAGIPGLQRGTVGGELTGPIPENLRNVVSGGRTIGTPGVSNPPTTEAMVPNVAPDVYRPDTGAFVASGTTAPVAPTPVPSGGVVQPGPFGIPSFPALHPREWDTQLQMTPWGIPTVTSVEKPKNRPVVTNY